MNAIATIYAALYTIASILWPTEFPLSEFKPFTLQSDQGEEQKVESETKTATSTLVSGELYTVVKVIDGDTISIMLNEKAQTVRLIGINTPETVDPRKPVECFGLEASAELKKLLTSTKVKIETDTSQGTFDKYNRLLGYVYTEDGTFANLHMIENGFGYEYTYATPYQFQQEFKTAQIDARENERGLWSPETCAK